MCGAGPESSRRGLPVILFRGVIVDSANFSHCVTTHRVLPARGVHLRLAVQLLSRASTISHIVRLLGVAQGPKVNKHTYQTGHSKDLEIHSQEPGGKAIPHLGQG